MRVGTIVTWVAALVLTTLVPLPASASPASAGSARTDEVGLWETDFSPRAAASSCGRWQLDARGFCTADDTRNGVELGMKFVASRTLVITGVRLYRVDLGEVTGSLWDADGTRLATGAFAATDATGWQDLAFSSPVTVSPGRTYVVSFYSPATKYAFTYGFFRDELTRGPITALRAVGGDPNGVHCYDVATCRSFPRAGFRDSAYWVTPVWENPAGEPVPPPAAPAPPADVEPPRISTVKPGRGSTRVSPGRAIRLSFSEQVRSALLTRANVRLLRQGVRKPVRVRLHYDARRQRLIVKPVARLRPRTTYRLVVGTRVVDIAGNRLDQDPDRSGAQRAIVRFRTR